MERKEQTLQKAVVYHLRTRGVPGLVYFHVPHQGSAGGQKGYKLGAIRKAMGVRAGASDLILLHDSKFFALELKADGGKPPTESQLEFLSDVNKAGGFSVCAEGLDRALACLEAW